MAGCLILLGKATEGQGVRARWSDAGRSCGVLLPLSAPAEPSPISALPSSSGARDGHTGPTPQLHESDVGTLQPAGRPSARTIQPSGEAACVVDLTQGYLFTGPLAGTAQIDYRILVQGTCDERTKAPYFPCMKHRLPLSLLLTVTLCAPVSAHSSSRASLTALLGPPLFFPESAAEQFVFFFKQ